MFQASRYNNYKVKRRINVNKSFSNNRRTHPATGRIHMLSNDNPCEQQILIIITFHKIIDCVFNQSNHLRIQI